MTTYPEWSWSQSRHHLFTECKRKYYYHYYGSYPGWKTESSPKTQRLYRLKQLRPLTLLFGEVIHRLAHMVIWHFDHDQPLPTADELLYKGRALLNQAVRESRDKRLWWEAPTKHYMLHELYYGDHLPPALVNELKERLSLCVHSLLKSRSVVDYGQAADVKTVEVEQLNKWILEETKVYVKVDWIYQMGEKWVIVDWKTGQKEEQHIEQLKWYALYLHQCYRVPLPQIELRAEYLLTGECQLANVTEPAIDEAIARMNLSVDQMRAMLSDRERNVALPEDYFPLTEDRQKCQWCNFKECCTRR